MKMASTVLITTGLQAHCKFRAWAVSWLCFGPSLPLPDHHPQQDAAVKHTQSIHFYGAESLELFGLCLGKKFCYPLWITQLPQKCSCPWFAWFVSCASLTASLLLCSKLLGYTFQDPGMQKIVQDPKDTGGIETSAKNDLVCSRFQCTHFSV